jgi:hypothetical protein
MRKGDIVIRKINKGNNAINRLKAMELALVDNAPWAIPNTYISMRS